MSDIADVTPNTRCKFRVVSATNNGPGSPVKIVLAAQYPDKALDGYEHGEDHAFFSATPAASAELHINNPYGAELFEPGEFVYADFSRAPNPYKQTPPA